MFISCVIWTFTSVTYRATHEKQSLKLFYAVSEEKETELTELHMKSVFNEEIRAHETRNTIHKCFTIT